jgi:hypothetical protein
VLQVLPDSVSPSYATEKGETTMGKSIRDMNKGGGGPPLLHGADVPNKVTSVKIKIKELREGPENFNSAAIIDFVEPVYECEAWAVNITNLKALAKLNGLDDDADFDVLAAKVRNKTFTLHVGMVNNPQTKKMVRSLFFNSEAA